MSEKSLIDKNNNSDDMCHICYDPINYSDKKNIVFCLNCKKNYHYQCMKVWKDTGISPNKKECPYCFKNTLKYPKTRAFCCLPFLKIKLYGI